jgi:type IX secretion system PorP/SprF family membrane protein
MKKWLLIVSLVMLHFMLNAQQVTNYTQFTFNKYGMNPAAAGTNHKVTIEAVMGTRRQWIDIDNPPISNFGSVNYNFIPKRSYRKWHNVGAYVDQDQSGVFANNGVYLSYAFHLILSKKVTMSVGVFAGFRRFFVSTSSLDRNDPAIAKSSIKTLTVPDIIPGIRLYSKKFFFDLSVRQMTTSRQVGIHGQIGSPSKLFPYFYAAVGRRVLINSSSFYLLPSISALSTYNQPPSFCGNLMAFYKDRVGAGFALRDRSYVGAIVQVRFLKNAVLGFGYEYSINRMRLAAANTYEIMIGIVPMGIGSDKSIGKTRIADCPALSF